MSAVDGWTIPPRNDACGRCGTGFRPGQIVTVVLRLPDAGPARDDLCATCGQTVEGQRDGFFWRRPMPDPGPSRPIVDSAVLLELFERMLGRTEPVYRRLVYLVGLVLIRKRRLRLQGFERRTGREVMVVTRGAGQPPFDVPAPSLSAEEMLEARSQLAQVLASELDPDDLERPSPGKKADKAVEGPETAEGPPGCEDPGLH